MEYPLIQKIYTMRTKQTIGNKMSMNSKILTTVTMAIIFAFLSFFSLNTLTTDASSVGNKMFVLKAEILSNKNVRWDYLMDQQVTAVTIEMSGKRKPMSLNNFTISLAGNSTFVMNELRTAFVCWTESGNQFNMDKIVSEKIDITNKDEFIIDIEKMKLKSGMNYFWIVVKPEAGKLANPQDIVVACPNITINNMKFEPIIPQKIIKENEKREAVDYTF